MNTVLCLVIGLVGVVVAGHGHGGGNHYAPYTGKNPYLGSYKGKCSHDGIFYHGDNSLVFCSNGAARVQYCAPGTRNSHRSQYSVGHTYGYTAFCDVNLNDYGYGYLRKHGAYGGASYGTYGAAPYGGYHGGHHGGHQRSYGSYPSAGYGHQHGYGGQHGGYGYGNGYNKGHGHGYGGGHVAAHGHGHGGGHVAAHGHGHGGQAYRGHYGHH